jgi:uncharacterized lipoprotein YmbA
MGPEQSSASRVRAVAVALILCASFVSAASAEVAPIVDVWSDPPADLIQRALVNDLAHRFGTDRVMATPVAHYATPGWRVALDVIRFDVNEGGDAVLDARWTLLAGSSDRLLASRREWIEAPSGDAADPAKRVASLREAVAMLASRIGDAITAAATADARRR